VGLRRCLSAVCTVLGRQYYLVQAVQVDSIRGNCKLKLAIMFTLLLAPVNIPYVIFFPSSYCSHVAPCLTAHHDSLIQIKEINYSGTSRELSSYDDDDTGRHLGNRITGGWLQLEQLISGCMASSTVFAVTKGKNRVY